MQLTCISKFWNSCFRAEIQRRLQDALLQDVELSSKKNVEQLLWKSAFYQVIEMLRHKLSEGDEDDARQDLLTVIDEVLKPSCFHLCPRIHCIYDRHCRQNVLMQSEY